MEKVRTNQEWLADLTSSGPQQADALDSLRVLLLRAALYTFSRNLSDFDGRSRDEVLELAEDCAQDALIAVFGRLETFRGESKFTTWAYKFAVNKALETARRERWKGMNLDTLIENQTMDGWAAAPPGLEADPELPVARIEMWRLIHQVINQDLTERQRLVLKLMVFDNVPMDVVVERLETNRNAIYKLLHDARRKIRDQLVSHGITYQDIIELFPEEDAPR